jgi:hypothetical protein
MFIIIIRTTYNRRKINVRYDCSELHYKWKFSKIRKLYFIIFQKYEKMFLSFFVLPPETQLLFSLDKLSENTSIQEI